MKLNLASGQNKRDGWLNVDISPGCAPDMVLDLLKFPWPWDNDSVEEVYISHFLEHVTPLVEFMNECYRVMQDKARMTVLGPYYTSMRAWQDPTHVRALSENLYLYFDRSWREQNGLSHYPINTHLRLKGFKYFMPNEWKDRPQKEIEWSRNHCWNVVSDFEAELEAIKYEHLIVNGSANAS